MIRSLTRHKLLIGATTVAVAASGGAAYAATQSGGTSRQGFIKDVAHRLHVSPKQLTAAVKAALIDRLQAEVKAGDITQAQANRIEQRIERGRLPMFFGPGERPLLFRAGVRAGLPAAAGYLGLTTQQLLKDLHSGKSLAQIATAQGKKVSGLERAIISAEKTRLNRAVANGHITEQQEQLILSRLSTRIDRLVNRTGWGRPLGGPAFREVPPGGPMMLVPGGPGAPPPPGGPAPAA